MTEENFWNRRRVSRRGVMRGAALGGFGLAGAALIGCGDSDEADTTDSMGGGNGGNGGSADATTAATTGTSESSADARHGGHLRFHIAGDPPNFDMHANSTYRVNNTMAPMYNMLVQFDPQIADEPPDAMLPDLAESWEISDDGLQYTFNLVQNAKYQDGQDFSSADVQATFDRIMNPPDGMVSPRRDQFAPVESIETPDDYTAVFNLSRPAASMLPIIATGWNAIYSHEDIGNGMDFAEHINGTGPFRFVDYQRGNRLEMTRNEEYHHPEYPYFDEITIFSINDVSTALASFQSGEMDIHRSPSPTDAEALEAAIGDQITIEGPMPSYGFGSVNFGQRDPWRDDRVRRALAMAISQEEAIAVYNQGSGYVGGYMRPAGVWAVNTDELQTVPGYQQVDDATRAEARKLLDAAGVANPYDTTILTRQGPTYERLSIFLKDQWTNIGINAELDVQETAGAYEALNTRAFDMAPWSHGYATDDPDALFAEFYISGAPRNYSEIGSQEVDDLFLQQSSELDPEARIALVNEMERQALDLYGKIIVSWSSAREARWNYVQNRVKHPSLYNNQRYERVWFDNL